MMRWRVKETPVEGSVRYRTILPIIPIRVEDYMYWLEFIDVEETYVKYVHAVVDEGELYEGIAYKWIVTGLDRRP